MSRPLKIFIFVLLAIWFMNVRQVFAQTDPILTQYMFNTLALNPAYAGTDGALTAMATSRHQWVGFENAPSTQTFTIHTPVSRANFGVGLSLVHDKIGPVTNTTTFIDYAYHLQLNRDVKLSLGLKGGFTYFQKDISRYLQEVGTTDQVYLEPVQELFLPNFGFGIYAWADNFYMGFSIPRLMENPLTANNENPQGLGAREQRLYLLMAGYSLALNDELDLKPSFLLRATESSPITTDFNLSLVIRERIWTGAMVRPRDALGLILKYKITPRLGVGYAYEVATSKLRTHFGNTHEIMVSFGMNFIKEGVTNPRIF